MVVRILSFIRIELGKTEEMYQKLQEIPQLKEIYAITGRYDLAIVLEAENGDIIHDIFAEKIDAMDGLIESNSHLIMKHKYLKGL